MSSNSQWVNDIVVNWALTASAIALTIGRYGIRYFFSQKLYWDDLAHFCALATLIAHGGTNQLTLNYKAEVADAVKAKMPSDQLLGMYEHLSYLNDVNNSLLYLVFWEVKVAFLLFYRHLFHSNKRFNVVWWIVLAVTVCLIWAPIGGVIATCAGQSTLAGYEYCNSATPARTTKLIYTCVVNVGTDLAIMALPFWMLRELKVKKSQKWGLAFIFSLAIFTVVLDIVRTVEAVLGNQDLYTILELNFNVIVSCLPSYRALLKMDQRKANSKKYQGYSAGSSRGVDDSTKRSRSGSLPWLNFGGRSRLRSDAEIALGDKDTAASAERPAIPARNATGGFPGGMRQGDNAIRVQREFEVSRTPGPRDPYAIEDDDSAVLVDPKSTGQAQVSRISDDRREPRW